MTLERKYDELEANYKEQISLARKGIALYETMITMCEGQLKADCIRGKLSMERGLQELINSLNNLK